MFSIFMVSCGGTDEVECEETSPPEGNNKNDASTSTTTPEKPSTSNNVASSEQLSVEEEALLRPYLDDLRAGIRPFKEGSVGICRSDDEKRKECTEFIGLEGGELPEGSYMLQARLRVPKLQTEKGWNVSLTTKCTISAWKKNGEVRVKEAKPRTKNYKVRYTNEERGYRLVPMAIIDSPDKHGVGRECQWQLVYHNIDGDAVVEGSWKVPLPELKK